MNLNTISLHSGINSEKWAGATSVPIFQSTSYEYQSAREIADVFSGKAPGHIYSRISNPTNLALEIRLNELENGIGCIVTSSGMAAISSVIMALTKSGDEVLTTNGIFGGTVSLFSKTLQRFGIKTVFVNSVDNHSFEKAITEKTKIIFIESICNPSLEIPDFETISRIAKEKKIPLVVDNTLTSPYIFRPGNFGADIIIHSTSKFVNGNGSAIGGAIIDTGNFNWKKHGHEQIKQLSQKTGQIAFLAFLRNLIYRDLGGCAAPFNSFLMLQGLETLGARIAIHCKNARSLAEYLNNNKNVIRIKYPGTGNNKGKIEKYFRGLAGSILTFGLGSKNNCFKFIDSLKIAKNLANLGDAKTLVIHPASTIFCEFTLEERNRLGISDDMIRVSVGIEDFEDIKSDFEQAIDNVFGS